MSFAKFYKSYLRTEQKQTGKHLLTTCPFCEHEDKLAIVDKTGQFRCAACDESGNHITFLTKFHESWFEYTEEHHYDQLLEDRPGIILPVLQNAKIAYDSYYDRWLIPYKNPFSKFLTNLGVYKIRKNTKNRIFKGENVNGALPLTLYNPFQNLTPKASKEEQNVIYICEGEWDALALLSLFQKTGDATPTLAVPGASIVPPSLEKWLKHFDLIRLCYDNEESGEVGLDKMQLHLTRHKKVHEFLNWSNVPDAVEKEDVRDLIVRNAQFVPNAFTPCQHIDVTDTKEPDELSDGYVASIEDIPLVEGFTEYINLYQKHIALNQINKDAIALGMAVATTQYMKGEPLWTFFIGPPGCGKTTFIESFGGTNEYFDYSSRITAKSLVSGWGGGGDPSMLVRMNGKCFFIKDFTVVLGESKDERRALFNHLRDIYDGSLRFTYGNSVERNYQRLNFNMLAGVTEAIYAHNDASMGERFLRITYMRENDMEDEILDAVMRGFGKSTSRKFDLTYASIGFVKYIRQFDWDLEALPVVGADSRRIIGGLAKYTAAVRTQVTRDRNEGIQYKPRREIASRLSIQFLKIAFGLHKIFYPERTVTSSTINFDDAILSLIAKVAFDTCEGYTQHAMLEIIKVGRLSRDQLKRKLRVESTRIHRVIRDMVDTSLVREIEGLSGNRGRPTLSYIPERDLISISDLLIRYLPHEV